VVRALLPNCDDPALAGEEAMPSGNSSNPSPAATLSAVRETDPPHILTNSSRKYPGTPLGHRTLFEFETVRIAAPEQAREVFGRPNGVFLLILLEIFAK